jgi:hypothetical protein
MLKRGVPHRNHTRTVLNRMDSIFHVSKRSFDYDFAFKMFMVHINLVVPFFPLLGSNLTVLVLLNVETNGLANSVTTRS